MIDYINLQNVSLRVALKAILKPLDLDYSIQEGFIWISTPEALKHETFEDLETRHYRLTRRQFRTLLRKGGVERDPDDESASLEKLIPQVYSLIADAQGSAIRGESTSYIDYDQDVNIVTVHNTPPNLGLFEALLEGRLSPR